jgi:hypothetical protein
MKQIILNHFSNCTNINCPCVIKTDSFEIISTKNVKIFDEDIPNKNTPSKIVNITSKGLLEVDNKLSEDFTFLKIDECLIISKENRKCDCAIYNSKEFYFIELKDTKTSGRKKAKKEAVKQLESTIKLFSTIDFGSRIKNCIIGLRTENPSIIQSSKNSKKAYFKDNYNFYLMEGSKIKLT